MKVELEIPKRYEKEVTKLVKRIDWNKFLRRALIRGIERELELEFMFRRAEKIASKSKLTEKQIKEFSEEVKERVSKRLGLV